MRIMVATQEDVDYMNGCGTWVTKLGQFVRSIHLVQVHEEYVMLLFKKYCVTVWLLAFNLQVDFIKRDLKIIYF